MKFTMDNHADGLKAAGRLLDEYCRSWTLLLQYDEQELPAVTTQQSQLKTLELEQVLPALALFKRHLMERGEATELFGLLRGNGLHSALGSIEQTFDGQALYPSVANRAAHLLYFIIKNHPFTDGNKRNGAFLFIWYLHLNADRLARPVKELVNDNTLVALSLLVAQSEPKQKDTVIGLIENCLLLAD